ncbi:MAG: YgjV family protein, partial [Clostridia bacterium]|nr:YgjV family protein [Clostridia bacterium]
PTAAMVLGTLFMWSRNGKILRYAQFSFISPCWLIYNVAMGSIAGVLTESVNLISVVVSLLRFGVKELDKTYDG